ncbi:hypothetical protein MRX96_015139 [Rhipicephalus microplus]
MAASRGLQDKIDAFEKKAGNTIMSADNGGQQLAGAQPDSAAEAVAPAPGSASTADGPAATNVSRRHQLLARTLIKAFKSADKTPMGITTRSRLICGCPMTPERGFLRYVSLSNSHSVDCICLQTEVARTVAAGCNRPRETEPPPRSRLGQMIVLRGLVALAAFLGGRFVPAQCHVPGTVATFGAHPPDAEVGDPAAGPQAGPGCVHATCTRSRERRRPALVDVKTRRPTPRTLASSEFFIALLLARLWAHQDVTPEARTVRYAYVCS